MKTFKGYGNFWKIYGMSDFQLSILELGLRFIIFTRPLRSSSRRAAHWLRVRSPRYERRMFVALFLAVIALSNQKTIVYNAFFGGALSIIYIAYVLFRTLDLNRKR